MYGARWGVGRTWPLIAATLALQELLSATGVGLMVVVEENLPGEIAARLAEGGLLCEVRWGGGALGVLEGLTSPPLDSVLSPSRQEMSGSPCSASVEAVSSPAVVRLLGRDR